MTTTIYGALKQGYMTKDGGKRKTWKKRWFILTNDTLHYFENDKLQKLLGSIPLSKDVYSITQVQVNEDSSRPKQIALETPNRIYHFHSESPTTQDDWFFFISNIVEFYKTVFDFLSELAAENKRMSLMPAARSGSISSSSSAGSRSSTSSFGSLPRSLSGGNLNASVSRSFSFSMSFSVVSFFQALFIISKDSLELSYKISTLLISIEANDINENLGRLMVKHLAIVIEVNRYPYLEKVRAMLLHNLSDIRELLLKTVKLLISPEMSSLKKKDKLVEHLKKMKDTIKNISEISPPSALEDISSAAKELTLSLLHVAKSDDKNRLLGDVQYSATKFEGLINHCAASLSSNEKQEMTQICSRIIITVKQLITYTEYGQPIDSALEVLTREMRGIVAFSQRQFNKQ